MATKRAPQRDETDDDLDTIFGGTPTPTATPAPATGPLRPGTSVSLDRAPAAITPDGSQAQLPPGAPPELAAFIAFKGRPPANLANPGQHVSARKDALTGDTISEGKVRYVWDDGDWVEVVPGPDGRPAISNSQMTAAQGQASRYELRRDQAGNLWRFDKQTQQPVDDQPVLATSQTTAAPKTVNTKQGTLQWNPETSQYEMIAPAGPQILSGIRTDQPKIAVADSTQPGGIGSVPNPIYDEGEAYFNRVAQAVKLAAVKGEIPKEAALAQIKQARDRVDDWYRGRGMELEAERIDTTRRGQDLDFARGMASFIAPKGTAEDLAGLAAAIQSGKPYNPPIRTMPVPFGLDPSKSPIAAPPQRASFMPGNYGGVDVGYEALQRALAQQKADQDALLAQGQGQPAFVAGGGGGRAMLKY